MVTSAVIRRVKKLDKVLQVRLPPSTERRLALMAQHTGLDKSALTRMALNAGLASLQKALPAQLE